MPVRSCLGQSPSTSGVLKAHRATKEWRTELQTMLDVDAEEGGGATMGELEQERAAEILNDFQEALGDAQQELDQRVKSGHKKNGPLWTAKVADDYAAHCRMRTAKRERVLSPSRYVAKYVEKRMRRAAKGIDARTSGGVRKIQNDGAKDMVPPGTSLVVAPRLNFHTFGRLARCVKLYFRVLALCNFHDRLHHYCTNHGAVLLNAGEGKTTKRCMQCGKDAQVGGSETFRCQRCLVLWPRDLKVSRIRLGLFLFSPFLPRRRRLLFSCA